MLFTIAKAVARCLGNFSRKIVPKKLKKSPNLVTLKFTQPMLVVHCGSIIQISLTHSAAHLYYFWVWVTLGPKTPSTFFETPVRVFRPKRCFGPSIKVKVQGKRNRKRHPVPKLKRSFVNTTGNRSHTDRSANRSQSSNLLQIFGLLLF